MTYQNIVIYLVLSLVLLSIPSLLENVKAQTNSIKQTVPQQKQNMNVTTQALMKVDIFELTDTLKKAKLAIVDGNLQEALTNVRDVETQLILIKPSPTKFLNDINKAINAIARSDIDKSLDTLTKVQVTILKAENQIFKAAVANPKVMQQFNNIESSTNEEEDDDDDGDGR
jgi:predicted Holliday junction resolvase-like endonuclease